MVHAQSAIEVEVPLHAAFDAWKDLAGLPAFFTGVDSVEPLPDGTYRLRGQSLDRRAAWHVRVAEQVEDDHLTMHTVDGPWDACVVLFERLGPTRTAVTLLRDHEPDGPVPDLASRVEHDLAAFKRHAERAAMLVVVPSA